MLAQGNRHGGTPWVFAIEKHLRSKAGEGKCQRVRTDSPWKPYSPRVHFKYQDAECPPVHGSPVAFALDDFGSQVLGCSTKGPRPGDREGHAQKSAVLGERVRLRRTESDNDPGDHDEAPSPPRGPTVLDSNADTVSKDSVPYKRSLTRTEMKKSRWYHSRALLLRLITVTETQERHGTCFPMKRRGEKLKNSLPNPSRTYASAPSRSRFCPPEEMQSWCSLSFAPASKRCDVFSTFLWARGHSRNP